jgi:probable phosphoglycerate mutase
MIYVVRHGETEWNAINKVLGRTDIPLNFRGMDQARELARSLTDLKVDVFLCSPLTRTRQTADAIAEVIGIPYEIDNRLIEQDFGKFEGIDRFAGEYQNAKREYFARYPGGESYFDMASRVYPLIRELEGSAGTNALLVTHGGIGRIIRSYFMDMGNEEFVVFAQGNCEMKVYP